MVMDDVEELVLTPEMEFEATDRDDDLGCLVASAFTFSLPPYPLRFSRQPGGEA